MILQRTFQIIVLTLLSFSSFSLYSMDAGASNPDATPAPARAPESIHVAGIRMAHISAQQLSVQNLTTPVERQTVEHQTVTQNVTNNKYDIFSPELPWHVNARHAISQGFYAGIGQYAASLTQTAIALTVSFILMGGDRLLSKAVPSWKNSNEDAQLNSELNNEQILQANHEQLKAIRHQNLQFDRKALADLQQALQNCESDEECKELKEQFKKARAAFNKKTFAVLQLP